MSSLNDLSDSAKPPEKTSFSSYIFFGLGALANGWTASVIGFYIYFYMTIILDIKSGQYAAISLTTQLFNAFSDPVIGVLSDNTKTRFGRRRPFIFASAILTPIFFFLLFTRVDIPNQISRVVYYQIMFIMFYLAQTMFIIPYLALVMELSKEDSIRNNYIMSSTGFFALGTLLGPFSLYVFETYVFAEDQLAKCYSIVNGAAGIVTCVLILLVFFKTSERQQLQMRPKTFRQVVKEAICVLRYKAYIFLMLAYISSQIAIQTIQFNMRNYFLYVTDLDIFFHVMLLSIASSILSIFPIRLQIARHGKRVAYLTGMAVFFAPLTGLIFYVPKNTVGKAFVFLAGILFGYGTTACFYIAPAMVNDVITQDYLSTGRLREGAFSSMYAFLQKVAVGLAHGLVGLIIEWSGDYQKGPSGEILRSQTESVTNAVRYTTMAIPLACLALSMVWMLLYPLTKERVEENQQAINERK